MRTFELAKIDCSACGKAPKPSQHGRPCAACGKEFFNVEIERSAWGIELVENSPGTVGAFVDMASDDSTSLFYRTHSFLSCKAILGTEIAAYMKAPLEERKRLYIAWKRREIQAELGPDHAMCDRCGVAFKVYENAWNRAGLCSKACHQAHTKSQAR
jgi:hypothetical protein